MGANLLSIAFISSEGSIMLLLQQVSGTNRSIRIVEVTDISDKDAWKDMEFHR